MPNSHLLERGDEQEEEGSSATPTTRRSGGKRLRSEVWNFFHHRREIGSDGLVSRWGVCKVCGKVINASSNQGTNALRHHLKKCGPQPEANAAALAQVSNYEPSVGRQAMVEWICATNQPISIGEHPATVELIRTFQPAYEPVTRNTTRKDIVECFHLRRQQLQDEYRKGTFCVALSSEIWGSMNKEDYISVATHFIDDEWRLQKRVIGFRRVDLHTGDDMSDRIYTVLQEWGLEKRILAVTLDNATSNNRAIDILKPQIGGCHDELLDQHCACHIINLIVKAGMENASQYIDRLRRSILFLTESGHLQRSFCAFCQVQGVEPRIFRPDIEDQWNSTYLMLESVLPYRQTFTDWHNAQNDKKLTLNDNDWTIAEIFFEFLSIFYKNIVTLSAVYTPTSNVVLASLIQIAMCFTKYREHTLFCPIVNSMKSKYMEYWKQLPTLYCFGFILDPRFKLDRFYDLLRLLEIHCGISYIEKFYKDIEIKFRAVYRSYEEQWREEDIKEPTVPILLCTRHNPVKTLVNSLMQMGSSSSPASSSGGSTTPSSQNSELENFMSMKWADMNVEYFDILRWWKEHEHIFPILSRFARNILSIPVSTVSSESAFNQTGRIIKEPQTFLTGEIIEALALVKDWDAAQRRMQEKTVNSEEMFEYFNQYCAIDPQSRSSNPNQ